MEKNLFYIPLLCINKLGYCIPGKISRRIRLQYFVLEILAIFNGVMAVVQYFYIEDDYSDFVNNTEAIGGLSQMIVKPLFFIAYREKILQLLQLSQNFWSSENCSEPVKQITKKLTKIVTFVQKAFIYSTILIVIIIMDLISFIRSGLPLGIWKMVEYPVLYRIVWSAQSVSLLFASVLVTGFDLLYVSFCFEILMQFKILSDNFKQLNVDEIDSEEKLLKHSEKLSVYIEHHEFLLRFVKDFQDCYSLAFVIQCAMVGPSFCLELYALMESDGSTAKLKSAIVIWNTVLEFSFYCIPAHYMAQEASTVADGIYNSNWYSKHFLSLKKATQLIIQRAQQEVRFCALGIIDVNIKTLINVLKVGFSICTLLRKKK